MYYVIFILNKYVNFKFKTKNECSYTRCFVSKLLMLENYSTFLRQKYIGMNIEYILHDRFFKYKINYYAI